MRRSYARSSTTDAGIRPLAEGRHHSWQAPSLNWWTNWWSVSWRLLDLSSDFHPGAAASLWEGLEETLTLQRLGLTGALYRTLRSTNAIENLNGSISRYTHNVKRWRDGHMVLRWVGAALHEASTHFRRVRGYRELPILIAALAKLDKETKKAA